MVQHLRVASLAALVALLSILSAPSAAHASACGTYPEAAMMLPVFARFFTDPGYAGWRGIQIAPISPTDSQYIVTDSVTCKRVYAQAVAQITALSHASIDLTPGAHEFAVYRYGPYYGIHIGNVWSGDGFKWPDSEFMVFRASDLAYVKSI